MFTKILTSIIPWRKSNLNLFNLRFCIWWSICWWRSELCKMKTLINEKWRNKNSVEHLVGVGTKNYVAAEVATTKKALMRTTAVEKLCQSQEKQSQYRKLFLEVPLFFLYYNLRCVCALLLESCWLSCLQCFYTTFLKPFLVLFRTN